MSGGFGWGVLPCMASIGGLEQWAMRFFFIQQWAMRFGVESRESVRGSSDGRERARIEKP